MQRNQLRARDIRPNYGVWDRQQRRYRWVSLFLVVMFLVQLVAPVWALPAPKRRPLDRFPSLEASAEKALRKAGNPLPQLPGMEGMDGYFPQDPESLAQVDPTFEEEKAPPSDTPKPEEPKRYPVTQENLDARRRQAEEAEKQASQEHAPPPQEEKEKSSSPHRHKDKEQASEEKEEASSDSHEDRHDRDEHHHPRPRKTSAFAVITPPGQLSPPRSDWSRLTSPKGGYFEVASDGLKTFANDHAVVISRNITALANPGHETILWEFISPVAENNGVGPHHNAAGAIQFDYFSTDSGDGRYRVSVRYWDHRHKSGRNLKDIQHEGALLKQYHAFAACACRDTGQWTFKASRGGKVIETTSWEVAEPPMPTTEWARRVHGQYNAVTSSPYVAWVGDEWLMHMKDFVFPAPDPNLDLKDQPASVRGTTVEWSWLAPAALKLNRTCFHTYLTVKLHYKVHQEMVNGQRSFSHTLKTVVYDSSYPHGKVYKLVEGPGLIAHSALNYGTGIPALSDWSMSEKINGVKSPPLTFKARYLGTSVQAPVVGYVDNGLTYNMQISTGPLDYVEKSYTWKLNLRDTQSGKIVRVFSGAINDNTRNYLELHQDFDGRDSAGQPIALGSVLQPEFLVQVPKSTPGLARTAAAASSNAPSQAEIAFAQLQANSGTNTSAPPSPLKAQAAATTTGSTTQYWTNVTNTTGGFTNVDIFAVEISHGTTGGTVDVPVDIPIDFSTIVPSTPQVQVTVGAPSTHTYPVSYSDIKLDNQVLVATTPVLTRGQNIPPMTTTVTPGIHHFTGLCTVSGFSNANPFFGSWGLHLQLTYPSQIADLVPQTESLAVGTQKTLLTNAGIINAAGSRQVLNGGSQAPVRVVRPNGTFDTVYTDLALRTGAIPITISRYWSPTSSFDLGDPYTVYIVGNRRVQFGWAWNFQRDLILSSDQKKVTYRKPEGGEDAYELDSATNAFKAVRLDDTKKLTQPGGPGSDFLLTDKSGYQLRFQLAAVDNGTPPTPRRAFLTQERDVHSNTLQYTYSDIGSGMFLKQIISNNGPSVTLNWADATTDPNGSHLDPAGFQYSQLASIKDHTGREVKYSYLTVPDPAFSYLGLLETVTQPGARVLTYKYDMAGLIQPSSTANTQAIPAWVFQANSARMQILIDFLKQNPENINAKLTEVDVNGVPRLRLETDSQTPVKIAQVSHPGVQTQTYQQISPFQVAITTVPKNAPPTPQPPHTWTHSLDASHRVVATRDPLGFTEQFAFDPAHNLASYVDGRQETAVTMTWDSHRNLRSVTDKLQHRTDFDYNSNDDLISIQDAQTPRGIRTFTYGGPENRELRQVSGPEPGHVEQFVYDAQGHLTQHLGAMEQLWKQTYVGGFLKTRVAPDGSTWTFDNDSLGRPTRVILPPAAPGGTGRIITTAYDTRDRVTSINNSGAVTSKTYDANDLVTNITLPPTPTNPQRRPTQYLYDPFLRVKQVNLPDNSTVLYQRDDFGNVVNMTNPRGAVTSYEFDSLNRVTSVTYPTPAGKESYHYNDLGQMDIWTKTDGTQIKYDFDLVGNLKTLSSGGNVQASFDYDSVNRVVQMDDSAGRTLYEYSLGSNLKAVTRPGSRRIEYDFDLSDRLTRTRDPEGKITAYDYTSRDELKTATTDG